MKCPACGRDLVEKTVQDVTVDVCDGGCGGIWFDWFELKKFDEPYECAGDLLELQRDETCTANTSELHHCPRCQDVVMARHYFSCKHAVEVDECPGCGGFWLDGGELEKIRSLFESEAARLEAGRRDFTQTFADQFAAMEAQTNARLQKARCFAHALRFICPSYYIPGQQRGGAF